MEQLCALHWSWLDVFLQHQSVIKTQYNINKYCRFIRTVRHISEQIVDDKCQLCKPETIDHFVSGCSVIAATEYLQCHNKNITASVLEDMPNRRFKQHEKVVRSRTSSHIRKRRNKCTMELFDTHRSTNRRKQTRHHSQ